MLPLGYIPGCKRSLTLKGYHLGTPSTMVLLAWIGPYRKMCSGGQHNEKVNRTGGSDWFLCKRRPSARFQTFGNAKAARGGTRSSKYYIRSRTDSYGSHAGRRTTNRTTRR